MTLGSHQRSVGKTQIHITPLWILEQLGPFGLDPCAADPRPWDCARRNYTERDDGLSKSWIGRVWLNPPFDRYEVARWIQRLAEHGHGTALLHARTEADWFEPVWQHASGILFMADRIKFCRSDGSEQPHNSGAPPVLVAFGADDLARLRSSGIPGTLCGSIQRPRAAAPRISQEHTSMGMNPELLDAVRKLVDAVDGYLNNDDGNDNPHIEAMGRCVSDVKRQLIEDPAAA
jgi:hypothetical protein